MTSSSSATQAPKPTILDVTGRAIRDVTDGMVHGSDGSSSILRSAGDIIGSSIPILGEQKALKDIYAGLTQGDSARMIGGLINLIPLAGSVAKTANKTGQAVLTKVSKDVAEKGVRAATLNFTQIASRTARAALDKAAKDPNIKKQIAKMGDAAFARTTVLLQEKLVQMLAEGKVPDLITTLPQDREHSFLQARDAVFQELGAKPDTSWYNLNGRDGSSVGKHLPAVQPGSVDELYSALGFRFVEPETRSPGQRDEYGIMWWKQDDPKADPTFGVETFHATDKEADRILAAYLNQEKSFRSSKRRTA